MKLPVFEFDRYREGRLMAQGARITREKTEEAALRKAKSLFGYRSDEKFVLTNAIQPGDMAGQTRSRTVCGLTVADRTSLLLAWNRPKNDQSHALGCAGRD